MQSSQTPTLMTLPFASGGGKNTIPAASQLPGNPGGASYTDGFPPATRTPIVAGGIPPAGLDMNGILFAITQITRWSNAGGMYTFNSSFASDVNVGGYPAGAELMSADLQGSWISLNDNNTDNPDTGAGTKWIPGRAYGITALSGLTKANVTLTPAQAAKNKITLAGTLTGNIQIILPTWTRDWTVVNNTSGAFTITVKTAAGSGVVLAPGQQKVTGDGTNIIQAADSIAAATLGTQAAQLSQVLGVGLRAVLNPINANTTLTAANMGQSIPIFGAGGITLTLPAVSATSAGQRLEFFNYSGGNVTVACADADGFVPTNGTGLSSIILNIGDTLVIESLGSSGIWYALGGSVQLPYSKAFTTATSGVVGAVRNLKMSVTAASASATLTADEIIVEAALGGFRYCLANFSKTINLATTGAGGMDTGSAPTSGFVALYAIYNPTTGASALLGVNATSAAAPNVYGGGNMPSGYTASALVSVWPTNGSAQFGIGFQADRRISFPLVTALSSSVVQASFTSISIASAVPLNAKTCTGEFSLASTSTSNMGISVAATASTIAQQNLTANGNVGVASNFRMENLVTPQTLYYSTSNSAGTPTFAIYISSYEF